MTDPLHPLEVVTIETHDGPVRAYPEKKAPITRYHLRSYIALLRRERAWLQSEKTRGGALQQIEINNADLTEMEALEREAFGSNSL